MDGFKKTWMHGHAIVNEVLKEHVNKVKATSRDEERINERIMLEMVWM